MYDDLHPASFPVTVWRFGLHVPVVHPRAFVHPTATLIGDVTIEEGCYIAAGAVLRGDQGEIRIERNANVQDNCVLHGKPGHATIVSQRGHVGHGAVLHGCTIGVNALVGMNSIVLDRAIVHEDAWVGAMSLVVEGFEVPAGWLVCGSPARLVKELSASQIAGKRESTDRYVMLGVRCGRELRPVEARRPPGFPPPPSRNQLLEATPVD